MMNDFDLGPPFAFVGCIGVLAAAMLGFAGVPAHYVAPWLLLPIVLYFIGRRQSRTGNYAATFGLVGLVSWCLGTFVLAPVTMRSGLCGNPLEYVLGGMVLGVAAYLPLVIPLIIFMSAAKRVRVARPGSLAARAEHRFIWAAGMLPFTWLTGCTAFVVILAGSTTWPWSLALAVAMSAQLAPLLADTRALRRIARYATIADALPTLSAPIAHVTHIDLGCGDALRGRITSEGAYRQAPQASLVLAGDPERSADAVRACMRYYARCLWALYAIPSFITVCVLLAHPLHL
jgi:hypothetical protein